MKLDFSRQIFEKYSNIGDENEELIYSMRVDGRTDMTKLIVAFRSLAKAS